MHLPVLKKEVLDYLAPRPNENFIDCTAGEGGHSFSILEKNYPKGKLLAIEWDPVLYKKLLEKRKKRMILINDSFANLKKISERKKFSPVSGILFDLGFSTWHLEFSGKGFSFLKNEPLLMRYDGKKENLTAEKIVNEFTKEEIEKILKDYGQEKFASRIASEIVNFRKKELIKSTFQLKEIIKKAIPNRERHKRIHFATKTFQALRIAVNDELENLKKALFQVEEILEKGGRLVVISFHSLEDKIVKDFFIKKSKEGKIKILTKKPVKPSFEEIKINPRCRSAKMRAAVKI